MRKHQDRFRAGWRSRNERALTISAGIVFRQDLAEQQRCVGCRADRSLDIRPRAPTARSSPRGAPGRISARYARSRHEAGANSRTGDPNRSPYRHQPTIRRITMASTHGCSRDEADEEAIAIEITAT